MPPSIIWHSNGFGPDEGSRGGSIFADEVHENSAVTGVGRTVAPGFFAPFKFSNEFVVGEVGLFGGDITVTLAADMQDAVFPGEDVMGIVIDTGAPDVGVEIIGFKEVDDFGFVGCLGDAPGEKGEGGESDEKRFHENIRRGGEKSSKEKGGIKK